MLQGLRNAGQSLAGKIIAGLLFTLLIFSFAIWGIGDIFRGGAQNTVARVGDVRISTEAVRNAYQARLQQLARQIRRPITPEQARLFGLDTQVLNQLVSEATFDQRAQGLGLAVSDALVAQAIRENPQLRGANGQFDRALFNEVLRANNLTEQGYVQEQRSAIARVQLADAMTSGLAAPLAMREAIARHGSERRSARLFALPEGAAGEIPAPTEAQLTAFHQERRGSFRAPEYRTLNVLTLNAEAIADPASVPEADAMARYEAIKGERFGTAERRTIRQLAFPSADEAAAAAERLRSGAVTFDALAAERNVGAADLTLGTLTRSEIVDPAIAEAAFALQEGGVSGPIAGRFGPVILSVTDIQPGSAQPFAAVSEAVRREIALERARNAVNAVHDKVEDLRASARPLPEIAKELNLSLVTIEAVDRSGNTRSGAPLPAVPERTALLNAAFNSDVGVDNEALRTAGGGYVWFDIVGIEPARDRPLEEVRDEVAGQWRADEVARRLRERAQAFVERLNKGEAFETIAVEAGQSMQTLEGLSRATNDGIVTSDVARQLFAVPVGRAGSAPGADNGRVLFQVTQATVPPLVTTTQEAAKLDEDLRATLADDLLSQYVAQGQKDLGVTIDQAALRRAIGGEI